MASRTNSKSKQEEALQFLDDLDSLQPSAGPTYHQITPSHVHTSDLNGGRGDPAEVLAFIDEITQKSTESTRSTAPQTDRPISRAGTPSLRKGTERVRVGLHPSSSASSLSGKPESTIGLVSTTKPEAEAATSASPSGRWGWSNVWGSASAAYQQARSVVDEQVKNLPKNEQVSKWGEGVLEYAKTAQLDKFGQDFKRVGLSTLNDILNVVAPPILEHEVIQVWLSHDMQGYDGIEALVYRSLSRVMEQVEGGDLIVNRGEESRPKDSTDTGRELNTVDGYEAALKLAQANLDELIKKQATAPKKESSVDNPVVYSSVYLRIQPFTQSYSLPQLAQAPSDTTATYLQFILHLADPGHRLVRTTVTQAIPVGWLELWEQYDWVENLVAESLRVAVEVLGQDYLASRMGWRKDTGNDDNAPNSSEETT